MHLRLWSEILVLHNSHQVTSSHHTVQNNNIGLHEMIEMPRLEASEQISAACSEFLDRVCPKLSSDWTQLDTTGDTAWAKTAKREKCSKAFPGRPSSIEIPRVFDSSRHAMSCPGAVSPNPMRTVRSVRSVRSLRGLIGPFISSYHLVMTVMTNIAMEFFTMLFF